MFIVIINVQQTMELSVGLVKSLCLSVCLSVCLSLFLSLSLALSKCGMIFHLCIT